MWVFATGFPKGKGCLKPAYEPITLARKPGPKVLPLGIDECRVGTDAGWSYPNGRGGSEPHHMQRGERNGIAGMPCKAAAGRWPANLLHDGSPDVLDGFPETAASKQSQRGKVKVFSDANRGFTGWEGESTIRGHDDAGSAARFFYCAKACTSERAGSTHPTMKPLTLMRWLVKLVAREGETVLDMFAGSGTTGVACAMEGRNFIGCELDESYIAIARRRIEATGVATEETDHEDSSIEPETNTKPSIAARPQQRLLEFSV